MRHISTPTLEGLKGNALTVTDEQNSNIPSHDQQPVVGGETSPSLRLWGKLKIIEVDASALCLRNNSDSRRQIGR